jgi:O-methyltransferase
MRRAIAALRRLKLARMLARRFPRLAGMAQDRITRGELLVPTDVLEARYEEALRRLLTHGPESVGSYFEFGVYRGESLLCMQRASLRVGLGGMRLFGFDSFAGLPHTRDGIGDATEPRSGLSYRPGALKSSYAQTVESMSRRGADWQRIQLIPGWYSETLTPEFRNSTDLGQASVIMIDCVLYSSTLEALRFCEPLIGRESIVFLDDWGAAIELDATGASGERRAFEEFVAANPTLKAEQIGSYLHTEDEPPSMAVIMLLRRVERSGSIAEA